MSKSRKHHGRIHPANYPILANFPVLQVHAEARDICVGKEIEWSNLGNHAVDQMWFSRTKLKEMAFSSFAYEYLSFDLILHNWLEMPPEPMEWELAHIEKYDPLMRTLLEECEEVALADDNTEVLPLLAKAREFVDAFTQALDYRFKQRGIPRP